MVYHTINGCYMKKISNFIPNKILRKKEIIDELDEILVKAADDQMKDKIHVINYTESSITIECDSSSVSSIVKFEKEKYLEIFKNYGLYNIQDLKIKIK
jgi:hypothetical protein|tara:strand:+ start:1390 stop:1686 length:297 start_codon:yes stop_codon:yes gene_type:complete